MKTVDANRDWKRLLSFLPEDYAKLAVEHRQLNTQWSNAKISSADVLLRFIFLHVGADLALRQTVAIMAESGGPKLSAVRLHYRMRRAQPYLAALVARMTSLTHEAAPERWGGYEMMCLDASTVSGPGATGIDARLHAVIRLCDLAVTHAQVTNVSGGESLRRFFWTTDQLVIADRGYCNPPGLAWVVDQKADVLVRVNRGSLPLFDADNGEELDVLAWCRALAGHAAHETRVYTVDGAGRKARIVSGRLIGFRLPEQEAEEARARVRKEHGSTVTAEQLEAAGYVILFTTAPARRLSAARCVEAYRLRWQVELLFKRWKSLCHFDRLPNYRDDTIQAWLTGKLLLGLLLDRIGAAELQPPSWTSRSSRTLARQPWKLTSILWPLMLAAIMPIRLDAAIERAPALVERLEALDDDVDDRQITMFRNRFYGESAYQNC